MDRPLFAAHSISRKTRVAVGGPDRRQLLRIAAAAPVMPLVAACTTLTRGAPAPAALTDQITVLGIPNGRFWPDTQVEAMAREAIAAQEREHAALGRPGRLPPAYFLAVSGGGDNGAFGAGLLCGWFDSGTIPTFKLVTGVSTGSMIAPFAFVGGSYYNQLRTLYTTITPSDIMKQRGLFGVLFGNALADTTPLFHLISRYLDERMIAAIADGYREGRLLLIGTTSLDQQRPVIWNVGAIAASGRPGATELIRKILLASAAIPGAFPPVLFDVEAAGRQYQEMNVDGGAVAQTFLYPPNIPLVVNMQSRAFYRERAAYIIRNGRLDPEWTEVEPKFLSIAGRAISTMIHYSGVNDIMRIYATTQRDGVDYNLAYIETDFPESQHEQFDPVYMRRLFDYGYAKARDGYRWRKVPPILDIQTQIGSDRAARLSRSR
jgi:hypothetical protein